MSLFIRWLIWPFRVVEIVRLGLSGKYDMNQTPQDDGQTARLNAEAAEEIAQWERRRPEDDPELRANRALLHRLARETDRHLRRAGIKFERDVQIRKLP